QEWWDRRRKLSYLHFRNRCWACKVHKSQAAYHNWLEAHECYLFDYQERIATFVGVCALCHACYNFIHDGRLWFLYSKHRISLKKYFDILAHGNKILESAAGNIAFYTDGFLKHAFTPGYPHPDSPFVLKVQKTPLTPQDFSGDWQLEFNGELHQPPPPRIRKRRKRR
ncbi:MAG: hypothetical protein ACWGQW_15220, partial [bacterium]